MKFLVFIVAIFLIPTVYAMPVSETGNSIVIPLGDTKDIRISVNNTYSTDINVTMMLLGYSPAWISNIKASTLDNIDDFKINDKTLLIYNLKPGKRTEVYVSAAGNQGSSSSNLTIEWSLVNTTVLDNGEMQIHVEVVSPPSFSGLNFAWVIVLIITSGLVFYKIKMPKY